MKLLETIKTKATAAALALWAWMLAKAVEWKLRERLIALWEKGMALLKEAGAEIVDISLPHTKYALPVYI